MGDPQDAAFLFTPSRPAKPRAYGITHVLDKGATLERLTSLLSSVSSFVDIWKFGWGTAYIDPHVEAKIEALGHHGVRACTGGTLLEIAWAQDRVEPFFSFAERVGFACVEVSNGAVGMPAAAKADLVRAARDRGFEVLAEVGSKDPADRATPRTWADEVVADLDAGARWVVTEGRESGTVGLYEPDGTGREDVLAALVDLDGADRIVYEAPRSSQQAWLVRTVGPNVNLGNINLDEIMGVEALRLGLRADTLGVGQMGVGARGMAHATTRSLGA